MTNDEIRGRTYCLRSSLLLLRLMRPTQEIVGAAQALALKRGVTRITRAQSGASTTIVPATSRTRLSFSAVVRRRFGNVAPDLKTCLQGLLFL